MVCKGPQQPDYNCPGWIELRDKVVDRDGHRCRNCGSPEKLEVHHWRPLPESCDDVNEWGYKEADCPLIVPESGLITLCGRCHEALTDARKIAGLKSDPTFRALRNAQEEKSHNIFELWALNDQQLPFRVTKETWSKKVDQFIIVEEIQIRKPPYGFAWGRYCREGAIGEKEKIKNSGTYSWRFKK